MKSSDGGRAGAIGAPALYHGRVNLHKLRVFCEVVERQSLSLAAQHLIVTPPVVSAHIRDLELFFGAKLLQQQGRRMLLTETGELVYRYALEVLRATEETATGVLALKSGESGRVVVGAAARRPGGEREHRETRSEATESSHGT